jgi:hypothetical protein
LVKCLKKQGFYFGFQIFVIDLRIQESPRKKHLNELDPGDLIKKFCCELKHLNPNNWKTVSLWIFILKNNSFPLSGASINYLIFVNEGFLMKVTHSWCIIA